jgi:hypothetical protein
VGAAEAIGARVLLVHAKHDAAKAWYARFGFEQSPTDPLHLLMLLKDVRAFLHRHGIGSLDANEPGSWTPGRMRSSRPTLEPMRLWLHE